MVDAVDLKSIFIFLKYRFKSDSAHFFKRRSVNGSIFALGAKGIGSTPIVLMEVVKFGRHAGFRFQYFLINVRVQVPSSPKRKPLTQLVE